MEKLCIILLCGMLICPAPDRYLPWQTTHPLAWDDFGGSPNFENEMMAVTLTTLNVSWVCQEGNFLFGVAAKFDRERSWHKESVSEDLLAHERLHFDITELFARKMRRHFALQRDACALTDEAVRADVQMLRGAWGAMERQYDAETDHSRNKWAQAKWASEVSKGLQDLEAYALP